MQLPDLRELAIRGRRAWRTRPRLSRDLAVAVIIAVALILVGWMLARPQTPRVNVTISTGAPRTPPTRASNATSCPAPTGTVTHINPGTNLNAAVTSDLTRPGDTLVLNNGTYDAANGSLPSRWNISGIHGTAANPIIIEAANDGGAMIDGTGMTDPGAAGMIWVTNSSHVIVCGFDVANSPSEGIRIGGSGSASCSTAGCQPSFSNAVSDVTLERVTAHNMDTAHLADGTGNYDCIAVRFNGVSSNANILLQDDATWGEGCRYGMMSYDSRGVTFRRDWDYGTWVPHASYSPAPRNGFGCYNSQNCTFENDIATGEVPPQSDNNFYYGEWNDQNCDAGCGVFPNQDNTYLGNIYYNDCGGFDENGTTQGGYTFKDNVYDNPANSTCSTNQGVFYADSDLNLNARGAADSVTNQLYADATGRSGGALGLDGTTPSLLSNSVYINNNVVFHGSTSRPHTYSDFFGNTQSVTLRTGDTTADPGYNTSTYGTGAYLMPAPNLTGHGQGGADIGAHVIYEYVNGSLTNVPLWPWPMESRIRAGTGRSVTYASGGGIWNTLDGVYP